MKLMDPIPAALTEIASILRQQEYCKQATDIEALLNGAISDDKKERARFRSEITQNKWYWGGMGTIADLSFVDREVDARFKRAYHRLATACESEGLGSIYCKSIADTFGRWIRDGVV
jgi:hypothetical protein